MKLNMWKDASLRMLLSKDAYMAYQKMKAGGMFEGQEEKESEGFDPAEQDVEFENPYEVLAFMILKRALVYTPVDTGFLRNSAYIKKTKDGGYEIGYTADYSTYVHEIGVNRHKGKTQYKFLEDATIEGIESYVESGYGVPPVNIQYKPLRIFIGEGDNPGKSIYRITNYNVIYAKDMAYRKRLESIFNSFEDGREFNEAQTVYLQKMQDFFNYYRYVRGMHDKDIMKEWIDRDRINW